MRACNIVYFCAIGVMLSGCGTKVIKPADQHLQRPVAKAENAIPQPIKDSVVLPPPKPANKIATYSVVVTNVPAQQILFALARDAKINLDIQSGIAGTVTINAINQTLPQILTRIARQVDMRYELDNGTLTVMPDTPYLHNYKIDYVNMSRESDSTITNASKGGGAAGKTGGSTETNNSTLTIKDVSKNRFWDTLTQNIKDILHETDKILPAGSSETSVQQIRNASSTGTGVQPATGTKKSAPKGGIENSPNPVNVEEGGMTVTRRSTFREAASVIANPENGIITVRATAKQHEKIQQFIDQVMKNAERQVMIEATIVQVNLNDQYQQGIDWSRALLGTKGFTLSQTGTAGINTSGALSVGYINPASKLGNIAASVQLLEQFGNVKVLSSPTLSVMNNQTAMLRVVDNLVYFTMTVTPGTVNTLTGTMSTPPTYTSTLETSPVGFTMSLTPQISDNDSVLLNIRPSITRLLGYVNDPNPSLANPCLGIGTCAGVQNAIPQTSTREMESVLRIQNDQIAVLGGLMEDQMNKTTNEVPLLGHIPLLGNLFQNRDDKTTKTELVIFLRPVVIKTASVNGDFDAFRKSLPDQNFFNESAYGKP
ncbi:MAG: pilus (MSHA type) biogenesis protein MshL [Gallionella sp.]|nr:pilus (MSHA type) biogenesis protein MshL [Gallionella sp.]